MEFREISLNTSILVFEKIVLYAVAVLFVAVASASASGILAPALGLASARGALEGALGGQWIPDVPVAAHGIVAAPAIAAGPLGLGLAGPLGLGLAGPLGLGLAGHGVVSSRGALEGALGGQWIPDTHGK
ncbi:hypothetical protein NQ318_018695 [Aromia moschata]|uniref:Uncharacterized protein n=1 Tax=Aromia moschata TaxID=1265417 RepID=A0AAV8ZIQ8_9CUCU|nr:hypothetical protein NQ318_018695 [Aromia moschata]